MKTISQLFDRWRRYRLAVRELSQLSDRELADLGIRRADISKIAHDSAHDSALGQQMN